MVLVFLFDYYLDGYFTFGFIDMVVGLQFVCGVMEMLRVVGLFA